MKAIVCHDDLDGIFSSELVNMLEEEYCKVFPVTYNNANARIYDLLDDKRLKKLIILDLGIDEYIAKELDEAYTDGLEIIYIDHHKSNLYLNKYKWSNVIVYNEGVPQCTMSNIPNVYKEKISIDYTKMINKENYLGYLIEKVREYDSFDYNLDNYESTNDFLQEDSIRLNLMFENGFIDSSYYIKESFYRYKNKGNLLVSRGFKTQSDNLIYILNIEYLKLVPITYKYKNKGIEYVIGIVKGAKIDYSIAGNLLLHDFPKYDSVILLGNKNGSIRSLNGTANEIAKIFGGDGHSNASGFSLKSKNWKKVRKEIK